MIVVGFVLPVLKTFPPETRRGKLRLVGSPDGREGSLTVGQDVAIYASVLEPGEEVQHRLAPGRHAWLQVAEGALDLNGYPLGEGDGAAVTDEDELDIAGKGSEFLLFGLG